MRFSRFIQGCLCASFFIACQELSNEPPTAAPRAEKKFDMHESSELAALMRTLFDQNASVRAKLLKGELPDSLPNDFLNMHQATPTSGILHGDEKTFLALADTYANRMQALKEAQSVEEAKVAYNALISTCASCHQLYCHGPLQKIKKLKLPTE